MTRLFSASGGEVRERVGVVVRGGPHASHYWTDGLCSACAMRVEWAGARRPCAFRVGTSTSYFRVEPSATAPPRQVVVRVSEPARRIEAPMPPVEALKKREQRARARRAREAWVAAHPSLLAIAVLVVHLRRAASARRKRAYSREHAALYPRDHSTHAAKQAARRKAIYADPVLREAFKAANRLYQRRHRAGVSTPRKVAS